MKSNTTATAKDSEEATGAGDGASAGNATVVNAAPTESSEVEGGGEGEGSAGTNNNNNDNEREQERVQSSSSHRNQVQHQQEQQGEGEEATDSVASASARRGSARRPDAFQIYSDDDTRMSELLGLAPANPNDAGEQQVNWRQLVGLSAAEQERRRRDVNAENGDTPRRRRTRLSYELHPAVFAEMWFGPGGEFDLNDAAARDGGLAERRGQGGRREQDQDDDDNEDLDNGGT